ncbi:MAG: hypothetical protein ACXWJK_09445, partial [Burkholderiaceae bacterium]
MRNVLIILFTICFISSYVQKKVKLEDVKDHIGDTVKVKGKMYAGRLLENAKNTPTLINVGGKYPNELLTIVIWGEVRKKFKYAPTDKKFMDGMAVVTGKVELYKDKPQIVIND